MNWKEKVLLFALYGAGVLSLLVFITTKNEALMEWATARAGDDGDLYRLAKVRDFKVEIPPLTEVEDPEGVDADTFHVFLFGDSFSEASRGHEILSIQLARETGQPVYHVRLNRTPEFLNPLLFFKAEGVVRGEKRIVVLERVERYIVSSFTEPFDPQPVLPKEDERSPLPGEWQTFVERWFTHAEQNYEYFLQGSSLTSPVVELWNTLLFRLMGRISTETPVYSLNPPMLFYFDETSPDSVSSFYHPHPDSLVAAVAKSIAQLQGDLMEQYNTELVFMPVPTKYTIYHGLVNNDVYDNFIPRLCAALERRGVRTVDLYEKFIETNELLYWPTDSHWNGRGVSLALEELRKLLATRGTDGHLKGG